MPKKIDIYKIALFVVIAFAVFARLKYFGIHRLSMDEAAYAGWANRVYFKLDLLFNGVSEIDKPPVLMYLQAFFYTLFGVSENTARFPNFLAGTGNVFLLYAIGKHYFNKTTGLVAAFLIAASPYCIAYDNSAYTDTVNVFFGLLSIYMVSIKRYFYAGVAIAFAFGTKQFGVLYLPLAMIAVWLRAIYENNQTIVWWSTEIKIFLKGFGIFTLGLLILSLFSNPPLGFLIKGFGNQAQLVDEIQKSLIERYWLWFEVIKDKFWVTGIKYLLLLIPVSSVYYIFNTVKKQLQEGQAFYLSVLFFVITYISLLTIIKFDIYPRYLMVISPFVVLLVSPALGYCFQIVHKKVSIAIIRNSCLVIMLVLFSLVMIDNVRDLDSTQNPYDSEAVDDKKFKDGAFYSKHDGIDHVAWYIKNKMEKRPILFICENETNWALKFYCYGYEFEKKMWITNATEIQTLMNQFPESTAYVLWQGKENPTYEKILEQAGVVGERVFVAHGGIENSVRYTILKLRKSSQVKGGSQE